MRSDADDLVNRLGREQKMKFKVGPAKTKFGYEVYIFEVSDLIHGKIKLDDSWCGTTWDAEGLNLSIYSPLIPNAEPLRVEFEAEKICLKHELHLEFGMLGHRELIPFVGKKVKVTVEEI